MAGNGLNKPMAEYGQAHGSGMPTKVGKKTTEYEGPNKAIKSYGKPPRKY